MVLDDGSLINANFRSSLGALTKLIQLPLVALVYLRDEDMEEHFCHIIWERDVVRVLFRVFFVVVHVL